MKVTVVYVDDNIRALEDVRNAVDEDLWNLIIYDKAVDALARLKIDEPKILLTDILMPEIDGPVFLERARTLHPKMICMSITAETDEKRKEKLKREVNVFQFLEKQNRPDLDQEFKKCVEEYRRLYGSSEIGIVIPEGSTGANAIKNDRDRKHSEIEKLKRQIEELESGE